MNELPLRKLFTYINGINNSPSQYYGIIGRGLKDVEKNSIVQFKTIKFDMQYLDSLNSDAKYLYDICMDISNGIILDTLLKKYSGKIHNARWLTLANSILRLYITKIKPSNHIILL